MFLNLSIDVLDLLLPVALILVLSKLLMLGCKKIKLPQVVGMLMAGVLIGLIKFIPYLGAFILSDSARAGINSLADIYMAIGHRYMDLVLF